jgi:hypothetical protein
VSGPSSANVPRQYTTRYLGFELEPAGGKYRVSHVYRDGPADKDWIDISVGDFVQSIDGVDIKAGDDYWKILSKTENEYIPVKVSKAADGTNAKTFRIASVTNLTNIKYEEWVANNRDSVDKRPAGRSPTSTSCDGSAVIATIRERNRSVLAKKGHHRRHSEQRRRQHRSGAARYSRAPAIPVLEQPQRRAHVGQTSAPGDCRTEGDDDELPLGVRTRK